MLILTQIDVGINFKEKCMTNNSKKLLIILLVLIVLYIVQIFYLQAKNTIIKVDGRRITKAQFNKEFEKNANVSGFLSFGIDINKDKNGFIYSMIKDKTIDDVIKQTLIDEEIAKRKIKITNDDIDVKIQNIIDKVGSKENFYNTLRQNGVSVYDYKKKIAEELKKEKLAKAISNISVSDEDALKYYKENLNNYAYPEMVSLSHIFVVANPDDILKTIKENPKNANLTDKQIQAKVNKELALRLEKANKLLAQVKKDPKSFAQVAIANSDDDKSAKQGGDVGYKSRQQMAEPISKVVFSLKPNEISGLIKAPHGYHILVVRNKQKAGYEPFEKVKYSIISKLEKEKIDAALDNLVQSLKKNAKIEYVNPEYTPKTIQERYDDSKKDKITH